MFQPSIYPFGLRIDEPITMLTDVLVAVLAIGGGVKLIKYSDGSQIHRMILAYFAMMGVATLLGGVLGHGFLYAVGFYWKLPGWLLSMLAVNFLERVMIMYSKPLLTRNSHKFLSAFNIVELLTFMSLAFVTLNFLWVQVHSTYGFLIVVFSFCVFNYVKGNKSKAVTQMMIAIGLVLLCSVVFVAELSISKWFNHKDLAHVIMAASAIFFYRASKHIMIETSVQLSKSNSLELVKQESEKRVQLQEVNID